METAATLLLANVGGSAGEPATARSFPQDSGGGNPFRAVLFGTIEAGEGQGASHAGATATSNSDRIFAEHQKGRTVPGAGAPGGQQALAPERTAAPGGPRERAGRLLTTKPLTAKGSDRGTGANRKAAAMLADQQTSSWEGATSPVILASWAVEMTSNFAPGATSNSAHHGTGEAQTAFQVMPQAAGQENSFASAGGAPTIGFASLASLGSEETLAGNGKRYPHGELASPAGAWSPAAEPASTGQSSGKVHEANRSEARDNQSAGQNTPSAGSVSTLWPGLIILPAEGWSIPAEAQATSTRSTDFMTASQTVSMVPRAALAGAGGTEEATSAGSPTNSGPASAELAPFQPASPGARSGIMVPPDLATGLTKEGDLQLRADDRPPPGGTAIVERRAATTYGSKGLAVVSASGVASASVLESKAGVLPAGASMGRQSIPAIPTSRSGISLATSTSEMGVGIAERDHDSAWVRSQLAAPAETGQRPEERTPVFDEDSRSGPGQEAEASETGSEAVLIPADTPAQSTPPTSVSGERSMPFADSGKGSAAGSATWSGGPLTGPVVAKKGATPNPQAGLSTREGQFHSESASAISATVPGEGARAPMLGERREAGQLSSADRMDVLRQMDSGGKLSSTGSPAEAGLGTRERMIAVGIHDPAHGWIEVRAQGVSSQITAQLGASSGAAHAALNAQLAGMTEFLAGREIVLQSVEIGRISADGSGGGRGHGDGSSAGGGAGHGDPAAGQGYGPQSDEDGGGRSKSRPHLSGDGTRLSEMPASYSSVPSRRFPGEGGESGNTTPTGRVPVINIRV